ncbi:MAG: hypothetical protein J1F05_00835 [Muribaculaceae bacterium]|nr:hypothetical protein [Muribaculaceae bacterium]
MSSKQTRLGGIISAVVIIALIIGVRACVHYANDSNDEAAFVVSAEQVPFPQMTTSDSALVDSVERAAQKHKVRKKAVKVKDKKNRQVRLRSPLDEPVPSERDSD